MLQTRDCPRKRSTPQNERALDAVVPALMSQVNAREARAPAGPCWEIHAKSLPVVDCDIKPIRDHKLKTKSNTTRDISTGSQSGTLT